MKKFRGNPLQWEGWWDVFQLIHDSATLPTVAKFSYLKSAVEDEAEQAIAGLKVSENNYQTAIDILERRYGGKEKRIFSHMTQLINLPAVKSSVESLLKLQDELLSHTRALENLEITQEQYGVFLTPLTIS